MTLILADGLSKHFTTSGGGRGMLGALRGLVAPQKRVVRAVDSVSFTIARGEVVGYLGPNGAGKSTTLKMLCGLLVPSAGSVSVAGRTPWRERKQHVARIGAVFGQRTTLWWDLPARDSFDLMRHIYKIPADRFAQNLKQFRDVLDLDSFLDTPVRALSLGQRMRADICAALLHDPDVLFLDEPTIGLDVVAKERIRLFIQSVNRERGTTVLLTTHDLADIERLCERVMIIDQGKLAYDGSLDELVTRFGGQRALTVEFAADYADVSIDGAELIERSSRQATYHFDRAHISASDLLARISARYAVADIAVREPDIEATIRRIYEEKLLQKTADGGRQTAVIRGSG
jgi:ABC-2 type transport system ATP-binding protein